MSDVVREIYIDRRMEFYEGYIPDDWASNAFAPVKSGSVLDRLLLDLLLAWRTTAYTAAMPATAIKVAQATTLGYARYESPDRSIIAYSEAILAKLSRKIPELVEDRRLRETILEELVTISDEFREQRAAVEPDMPIEPIWQDFLTQDAFFLSVWSSQRVAFVAFYNAYEAFLIDCAKQVLGVEQLRTTEQAFKEALRTGFGKDISVPCWTHHEINNARLVRHALSHAGGRETADLKKQKHGIRVEDGAFQIVPDDNHNLLRHLRGGVEAIIGAAAGHPRLSCPKE
jgi:hypothetical protein